jgi:large subunit ribosomal protein L29
MKTTEIVELTDKELNLRIREERTMFTKLKFGHAVSPVENPNKITSTKKLIARLLTEQRKRTLAKASNI